MWFLGHASQGMLGHELAAPAPQLRGLELQSSMHPKVSESEMSQSIEHVGTATHPCLALGLAGDRSPCQGG